MFEITRYKVQSEKIKDSVRAVFFSDLHNALHGEEQQDLIRAVSDERPDLILVGGDMLTARDRDNANAKALLKAIPAAAPVFYVNGNHEECLREAYPKRYQEWERFLSGQDILLLNNQRTFFRKGETELLLCGYEAPLDKYRKFRIPQLSEAELEAAVGEPDPERFTLLMVHTPALGDRCFAWGADLICSGHSHGGVMRLGGNRTLVSPYGFPFPHYGYGLYKKDAQRMIVTSGLGEHTIPFRIHNSMEITSILIEGTARKDSSYGA